MFSRLHGYFTLCATPNAPETASKVFLYEHRNTLHQDSLQIDSHTSDLHLIGVVSNAQVDSTIAATIPNSEEFLIDGPNGRKLRIQISHPHPDDPSLSLPIQDQKPVPIFVLDGGLTFGLFSTVARYMQWGGELPPSLVIGVGYEDEAEAYNENYRLRIRFHTSQSKLCRL